MRRSANKKLWSKVIIALIVSIVILSVAAANGDTILGFFGFVGYEPPPLLSTELPEENKSVGEVEKNPPLYLASSLDDNAGISPGSSVGAGYPIDYRSISVGKFHTLISDADGFVYAKGSNEFFQLGLGAGTISHNDNDIKHYFNYMQPVVALNNFTITKVAAGGYHSIAVGYDQKLGTAVSPSNYKVFTWGRQSSGRLGNGATSGNTGVPQDISGNFAFAGDEYPTEISAGEHHSMLLTNKGNIYTWGSNWYGQLGLGRTIGSAAGDSATPLKVTQGSFKAISAGSVHSLALANNGYLWSWGGNTRYQLGAEGGAAATPVQRFGTQVFTSISAGELHNIAMNNATAYAWGDQRGGKLGNGEGGGMREEDTSNRATLHTITASGVTWKANSASAGGGGSFIIRDNNTLYAFGYGADEYYSTTTITAPQSTGITNVDYVYKGLVIKTDKSMLAYGNFSHYSENWYGKADTPVAGEDSNGTPLIDTRADAQFDIKKGTATAIQENFTPYRNIVGIPTDYDRHGLSNTIAAKNEVIFDVDRVKITSFHDDNHGGLTIAQVSEKVYSATTTSASSATFTLPAAKSYVVSREGYYVVMYKQGTTPTYKKFQISNKEGPQIVLNTEANQNNIFATISLYDGFGLNSITVNGEAWEPNGTSTYNASHTYGSGDDTVYNATFTIKKNSTGMFNITATDRGGTQKTRVIQLDIDSVVYLNSAAITKPYDGHNAEVERVFYSKNRGSFNLATFNTVYGANGYSVSAMQYKAGGTTIPSAPVNASATPYKATYTVAKGGVTELSREVDIVINKATPNITAAATPIVYGQNRDLSGLHGTAVNPHNTSLTLANGSIAGGFSYPGTLAAYPEVSATGTYVVTFTPTGDSAVNYNATTVAGVQFTVLKATPSVSDISSSPIIYEQALLDSAVSGTVQNPENPSFVVEGSWVWRTADFPLGFNFIRPEVYDSTVHSTTYYPVSFYPTDSDNYHPIESEIVSQLTVNPKAQTITLRDLSADNLTVVNPESLRTDIADYEVSLTAGTLTFTAYTTAIYPSARQITLASNNPALATVAHISTTEEDIDGILYSKSVFTITLNTADNFGIVTLTATQTDNDRDASPDNRGNYLAAEPMAHRLFIKREHTAQTFTNIVKTYGNPIFDIAPALNSLQGDFTLVSANTDIITMSGSGLQRQATIVNAGEATLNLSHLGYVDETDFSQAYLAMSASITVTVNPAPLSIKLNDLQAIYGNAPVFTYEYTGLVYGEQAADVIKNLTNDYNLTAMKNVINTEGGYGYYVVTPSGAENTSDIYQNYDINVYLSGNLTVVKRELTATYIGDTVIYGTAPDLGVSYAGFAYGENESVIDTYATVANSNTNVGSYTLIPAGAEDSNYSFAYATGTLTINKKQLIATYTGDTVIYGTAPALGVSYTGFAYGEDALVIDTLATVANSYKNVGGYTLVPANAEDNNYSFAYATGVLTITRKDITVTADAKDKTFGNFDPAFTLAAEGLEYGETEVYGILTRDEGESAGQYDILQGTVNEDSNPNYTVIYVKNIFTINPREIDIKVNHGQDKEYRDPEPLPFTYTAYDRGAVEPLVLPNGVEVVFNGALIREEGENVRDDYAIYQGTLTTENNPDYIIFFTGATFEITIRYITVKGVNIEKYYGDLTPDLEWEVTVSSILEGDEDNVTVSLEIANYSEDVGVYNIISTSYDAEGNYEITFDTSGTLTIHQRPITINADSAFKIYGDQDITPYTYTYIIKLWNGSYVEQLDVLPNGIEVEFFGTLTREAGEFTAVYQVLQGELSLGGNYAITYNAAEFTINQRPITLSADAKEKTYGEDDPELTYQVTEGNIVFDDTFVGALSRAEADNQNAGSYQISSTLDNVNYLITYVPSNLTIKSKPITVTAEYKEKEYGYADPELTYIIIGELAYGETSINGGLVRAEGEGVTEYDILEGSLITENPNYNITYEGATFRIKGREITIAADIGLSKIYGTDDPVFTYQIIHGELLDGDEFSGALTREMSENVGEYAILIGTLSLPEYYELTFVGADFEIFRRALTVSANAMSKTYGNNDPVLIWSITQGTLAFSETILQGMLVRESGQDVGSYAINQGTLNNDTNPNYNITYIGEILTINKRAISIRAEDTQIAYGDPDPAIGWIITNGDLAYNDTLFGAQVRTAGNNVGDYAITRGTLDNSNYQISYEGGIFTINKRVVVATINNLSKYYGDPNPEFVIHYSNFAQGESIATEGITAPVVLYGSVGQFSNVGSYAITLSGGAAGNYTFDVSDTATLTILRKQVNISLDYLTAVYNGMRYSRSAVITGVEAAQAVPPANDPHGVTYEYSKKPGVWISQSPNDAGLYTVKVTYTAHTTDNYATTVKEFPGNLYISPITPTLGMDTFEFDYTGDEIEISSYATGITTGTAPAGTARYLFSTDGISYSDDVPVNVGVYSVRVVYQPAEDDNYKETSADFENYITINKIYATINLQTRTEVYSSADGISADSVAANAAVVTGVKASLLPSESGRLTYLYFIGGEWRDYAPIDAGSYPVRIEYTAYPDENYLSTQKEFDGGVVITKASIFDLIELSHKIATYNGNPQEAGAIGYSGIAGGSNPRGTFHYEYQAGGAGMYTSQPFINAGEYNVRVVYTTNASDNYASVAKTFAGALVITKAAPIITPIYFTQDFNGSVHAPTLASVSGIEGGSSPTGRLSFRYFVDEQWTQAGLRNAGAYSGEVSYQSGGMDNYADTVVVFTEIVRIRKITPDLLFPQERYDYTGEPVEAQGAIAVPRGTDTQTPEGVISYLYLIDDEWTEDAPYKSGTYSVKVIFTAALTANYSDHENIYHNVHTIRNVRPIIGFMPIVKEYDGQPVTAAGNEYIVNDEHGAPRGQWLYEYDAGGGYWTNSTPHAAGEYSVRVRYYEALSDNYTSATAEFAQAIIIQPKLIVVTPVARQEKVYNGQMIIGSTIQFNRERLIQGNEWTGTLDAGIERNAGTYLITQGTLSAGKNYNIQFTEGIVYRTLPKEITLNIPNENYVYDGTEKWPKITANAGDIIRGDILDVYTLYTGDNLNVGSFVATASINAVNYSLPSEKSATYTIAKAVMTDNVFNSYEVRYNGKPHELKAYVSSGAIVNYNAPISYIECGTYTVTAQITKPNYEDVTLQATLKIITGKYNVQVRQPSGILYYGDPMPALYSNQDEYGTVSFLGSQNLQAGVHNYHWVFTPNDTVNYETETGTITLNVQRAKATIEVNGIMVQRETDITIPDIKVYGLNDTDLGTPRIVYIDSNGVEHTTFPVAAGRYIVMVSYEGNEHYAPNTYTTTIEIKKDNSDMMKYLLYGGAGLFVVAIGVALIIARLRRVKV
ncbi:MAG: MBG domain-containing protein [Clostridia bacterium]